jgi:Tol biopolymer transport system component/imidazolonepropionase-like amidohydrolase
MHSRNLLTAALLSLGLGLVPAGPAVSAEAEWNVNASHGPSRTVRYSTDEGTWMDLDVSPDGSQLVFSLVGDIYLLPIAGGSARRISSGAAWDVQPRFSPDGREIAFTSDRGGGNNLWRMNVDGSRATAVTDESYRLLNNPIWTPDGQYLIGRKHFSSERSLGAGELWLYHRDGGDGLQLVEKPNDQQDLGEPALSPDGRYLYYSQDVTAGPVFRYNKNPYETIYAINRLDLQTRESQRLVDLAGGAVRPQPSPDGRSLAFVRRVRDKTVLHVMDLASGRVRPLWDGLSHDQQEVWAIFGPYPNYDWLPDSSALVIWAQGKLWRVDAASGAAAQIPFNAEVVQTVAAPLRFNRSLDGENFTARMIRDVATAPDGRSMVFHAVGQLWRRALPSGAPQRLTDDQAHFEYQPSFSRDGRQLLYTTWSDSELGAIWLLDLASGQRRKLSGEPGFYYSPRFSPDGRHIVYSRQPGGELTGEEWSNATGVYLLPVEGGTPRRLAEDGYEPQFNADGSRVIYMSGGGLEKHVHSVGLHGEQPREIFTLKYADFVSISPDGRHVAFTELFNAYVAPLPQASQAIELARDSEALPVTRLSPDSASYLHWSADSRSLHWMVGDRYFTRALGASAPDAGVAVGLSVPTDRPTETMAFRGGRVVTMRDAQNRQEVIENGVVVVQGERIVAVGAEGEVSIPAGARVVDASGHTLYPGIVDVHGHAAHFNTGVVPQQNWAYYANLAFGITTVHDPSATTETVFSQAELQRTGTLVGPRIFSTGTILYGADGDFRANIDSLDDARGHLRRLRAVGAFSVKSYNQPRRDQRQQVNTAARELGMLVVEEGGSTFNHNMTMILDGVTGIEHNVPVAPLYRDVVELWRQTDVRNTPTLIVGYGGINGEYWWYARDPVWENARLQRYFPREELDSRSIRREIGPDWDYYHVEVARSAKRLRDAGVRIQVGGHGQLQGLGTLWEMWMLTQGGFSNWEALRAATIDGADYIGYASEFGSIEAGKRADLVIVPGNPLEDIRATAEPRYVMVNGRLFDGRDMSEIGGRGRPAPTFFWQRGHANISFGQTLSRGHGHGDAD